MHIRQATYRDKPALLDFLKQAYPGRWEYKFPHRWAWAYEENPYLAGERPPVWIAEAPDGRIVGQSAALVEPLEVEGRSLRAGWGVDFHVLPEYRGQGIGTRLQAANNQAHEAFMSLSMAPGAARIKERLGLQPLPPVTLYERILQHDPESVRGTLVRRLSLLPEVFSKLTTPVVTRFLNQRDRLSEPPPDPVGLEIRREPRFTEAFDRLWEHLRAAYNGLIRRDARYLTWKYSHQPHVQHEIFGAYRDGSLKGYLILRRFRPPEREAGVIKDLFCAPGDDDLAGALLARGLWRLNELGAQVVSFAAPATADESLPWLHNLLVDMGFKVRKQITPLARIPDPVPAQGWLFGKGDHDWDQYPLG